MIHLNQRLKVQYAEGKQEMGSYLVTKARHNLPNRITAVDDVAYALWKKEADKRDHTVWEIEFVLFVLRIKWDWEGSTGIICGEWECNLCASSRRLHSGCAECHRVPLSYRWYTASLYRYGSREKFQNPYWQGCNPQCTAFYGSPTKDLCISHSCIFIFLVRPRKGKAYLLESYKTNTPKWKREGQIS